MPVFFWDASALAKRYVAELGTATVNTLFHSTLQERMVGTVLGYAETFSILLRHHNRGAISATTLAKAKSSLRVEVVENPWFDLLTVDNSAIFAGMALMERYNINANDGAILAVFLRYRPALPPPIPDCVLVASDLRLLAAAQAEGLTLLNPEIITAADIPGLLGTRS